MQIGKGYTSAPHPNPKENQLLSIYQHTITCRREAWILLSDRVDQLKRFEKQLALGVPMSDMEFKHQGAMKTDSFLHSSTEEGATQQEWHQ